MMHPRRVDLSSTRRRRLCPSAWPAAARGDGYTLELTRVTPERDNDLGENWRRSLDLGGSPGDVEGVTSVPRIFVRRGDLNADAKLNVTDVVLFLEALFRVREEPSCLAALDVNADAATDLADALAMLGFLFQGRVLSGVHECAPLEVRECQRWNFTAGE